MGSDNIYFTAAAGTPAAKPATDWAASVDKHKAWVRAFVKRHALGNVEWVGLNEVIFGFEPVYKTPCLWSESQAHWKAWLDAHPLWRRVKSRRGSDYAVPRRDSADGKALAKEWAGRPRPRDPKDIGKVITGVQDFMSWMNGLALHHAGWRLRPDGSVLLVVPYFVTTKPAWKPLTGLKRGNQDKLRAEWHAKED